MKKLNIVDKRLIDSNNSKPDDIPFLGGRPTRETVISRDDLLNLTILLNTTGTIEEFLAAINE